MDDTTSIKSGGTLASAGAKRKRATEPKFYAVRIGFKPGIYYTWEDCLKQVTGYKKAKCREISCLWILLATSVADGIRA